MMKRYKNNKGVTLVELLVAVAVLSLLAIGTITVMSTGFDIYSDNMKSAQVQPSMRLAMIQITKLVRNPANDSTVEGEVLKVNGEAVKVDGPQLKWGSVVLAEDILFTIKAAYADNGVIQVDLVSTDGGTMSTKISKPKK